MNQLSIFDDRTRAVFRESAIQTENLVRVSHRISAVIVRFCRDHAGQEFRTEDLRRAVEEVVGHCAPGSPDRILRDCRQKGLVNYTVVNRSQSLYKLA